MSVELGYLRHYDRCTRAFSDFTVYDYSDSLYKFLLTYESDERRVASIKLEAERQSNEVKRWLIHLRFESLSTLRAGRLFLPKSLQTK